MTDWARFVRPALHDLRAYDPGPNVPGVVPLNRNEDLFPPFPGMREAVERELANVWRYPDETYPAFRLAVAAQLGTTADRIVPGHGVQALIGALAGLLLDPGDAVVVPRSTYGLYAQVSTARGADVRRVPLRNLRIDLEAVAAAAAGAKVVWICDPNNPTASLVRRDEWGAFLEALPDGCVVVADEAYVDYVDPKSRLDRVGDVERGAPLVVLRTLSKLFGIAGLRLGYAIADPALAHYLEVVLEPFNVNRAALAAGLACLARPDAIEERRLAAAEAREVLCARLRALGMEPLPSQTNFVLVDTGVDDAALGAAVAEEGFAVRGGREYGLDGYVRITIGPVPLMEGVADALARALPRLAS